MKKLIAIARLLRKEQTPEEDLLWSNLRNRRCIGVKFRRQYPIGNYILDFYCQKKKLAIELDGQQHSTSEGIFYDAERTRFLQHVGIKVLRFNNHRIRTDMENVLKEIKEVLKK